MFDHVRRLSRVLPAAALTGCLALAACGTGTSSPSPGTTSTAVSGSSSTPSAANPVSELAALSTKGRATASKVSYQFSSSSGSGTFTEFWMPPSSSRIDVTASGQQDRFITTGRTAYLCTASTGQCLSGTTEPTGFLTQWSPDKIVTQVAAMYGATVTTSNETVAGVGATCYSVAEIGLGFSKACFASSGVLVSVSGVSSGATFTLTAAAISTSVSSSDFSLPYPATALTPPAIPGFTYAPGVNP